MKVDFSEIKRTTDLIAVIHRYGIELRREGKDWRGKCPFHADEGRPNLIVTPEKGLFHCPACGAAGNVIQFAARMENLTEREAALKLLGSVPGVKRATELPSRESKVEVSPEVAAKLLARVAGFYAKTMHKDRAGLEYLQSRQLADPALLETFGVGYCNGSMRNALPKEGEVVEQLKAIGVLNDRGNEVFYGRVVVPIHNAAGDVVSLYGRRLNDEEPRHIYLRGPLGGVFNARAAKANRSLILVESIFDAMSLWSAGFRNAVPLYGVDGWGEHHEALIRENGVTELYLALDNDERGQTAVETLKQKLSGLVASVYSIAWPDGTKDANDFFSSRIRAGGADAAQDFEALLKAANPPVESSEPERLEKESVELRTNGFAVSCSGRRYELCAVEKPNPSRLKATIKAMGSQPHRFVIDTVDFYLMRSKRGFMSEAARLFQVPVETIEGDVNQLTEHAEAYIQRRLEAREPVPLTVNDSERAEALKLGRHPDLAGEILRDLEKLGLVGEDMNKFLLYLVMTSRRMSDPLAVQILSGSGAGKSHLQDAVLSLCPEEELIKLTALTDRALFYKGEESLRHKVLAVEEVAGADGARYAVRNLISAKKLTIESTIKNPISGRLETQVNTVYGPTAVFETTTQPDTDPETKSRFIITSIDESTEQTRRILEAQRHSHTLEGMRRKHLRTAILGRHHTFQRLLRPLVVVNPYEPLLSYGDDRLLFRRDNPKYLRLILAITFLYQHQRPVKHDELLGDYIETTLDDIAIAHELALKLFGQSLDELSRPSAELLRLIRRMVEDLAAKQQKGPEEIEFTRREVREFTGWSDYQIKAHIKQLEELEYLIPISGRRGQLFSYRLAWEGQEGRFISGLVNVEELRKRAELVGLSGELGGLKINLEGGSRAEVGLNGNGANPHEYRAGESNGSHKEAFGGKRIYELHINGAKNGSCVDGEIHGRATR